MKAQHTKPKPYSYSPTLPFSSLPSDRTATAFSSTLCSSPRCLFILPTLPFPVRMLPSPPLSSLLPASLGSLPSLHRFPSTSRLCSARRYHVVVPA